MIVNNNAPITKSVLEAECRSLWRAAYAARVANDGNVSPDSAAIEGDLAVKQYRMRYEAKEVSV